MKHDLSLRFEDEAAAIAVLPGFRTGSEWRLASHTHALDPIGAIVVVEAVYDFMTNEILEPAVIDARFHVNLQTEDDALAAALADYVVTPVTRRRAWA